MKKINLIRSVLSGLTLLALATLSSQTSKAANFSAPRLGVATIKPSDPAIQKGDHVVVIIKRNSRQRVPVYNKNAVKMKKTVKMGTSFVVKTVKKVQGMEIARVKYQEWLKVTALSKR